MKHQTSLDGPYHATWMQSLALCPMKAKLAIEEPSEFTSLAQFRGSVVHRMLEIGSGDLFGAIQHCKEKLDAPLIDEVDIGFSEECQEFFEGACKNAPHHESNLREFRWATDIGGYQFEGTLDALWEMPNGETWLIDWKTNKQLPSQFNLDNNLQFGIYAFMCRQHGIHIDKIAWIHLRDWLPYKRATSKKNFATTTSLSQWAATQQFELTPAGMSKLPVGSLRGPGVHLTQRTDAQLDEVEREVKRLIKMIKFNLYPRCMYDQVCSFCGYKLSCGATLEGHNNIKVPRNKEYREDEEG